MVRRPKVVRLPLTFDMEIVQQCTHNGLALYFSPFPSHHPPTTLIGNVLQRDIHASKGSPADVGRALLPGSRRLLVALDRRTVVG
jgi:hypothetical protein